MLTTWKCRQCQGNTEDPKHKSFFTGEYICRQCLDSETEIKQRIVDRDGLGADLLYKGCGFVPIIK